MRIRLQLQVAAKRQHASRPPDADKLNMVEQRQTVFLWVLIAAGSAGLGGGCGEKNAYVPPPPPEVTVARPVQQDVTNYIEETGTTEAVDQAVVRARVQGFVEEVRFAPGQDVQPGETLFIIEKDQYEAAKNAADAEAAVAEAAILVAEAQVKTVETEVERSRLDFERQATLLETNATSQQDYDLAKATWETAKANLESAKATVVAAGAEKQRAEAKVAQAALELGYTTVTAPLAGRITKTAVKRGNLVEEGSELATIVDDRRIFANFNLNDRQALRIAREARIRDPKRAEVPSQEIWSQIEVELRTEIETRFFPPRPAGIRRSARRRCGHRHARLESRVRQQRRRVAAGPVRVPADPRPGIEKRDSDP